MIFHMFDKSKIMCDFRLHVVSIFLFLSIKNLYNIFWCFSLSPTTSRRPPYSPNFMFLLSLKKIKRRKNKVKTNKFKSRKSIGQNVLKPNKRHMQKTWSPFCDGQLLLCTGPDLECGWCSTGKTFSFPAGITCEELLGKRWDFVSILSLCAKILFDLNLWCHHLWVHVCILSVVSRRCCFFEITSLRLL